MSEFLFDKHESKFAYQLSEGHMNRKGHELTGVWVYDNGIRHLERTCC